MPSNPKKLRVLYIDDDPENLDSLLLACEDRWDITTLQEARPIFTGGVNLDHYDVLFLDLVLKENDPKEWLTKPVDPSGGLKVLSWIQIHRPKMPVIVVTGIVDDTLKQRLQNIGPWIRYVEKPVVYGRAEFIDSVESLVKENETA